MYVKVSFRLFPTMNDENKQQANKPLQTSSISFRFFRGSYNHVNSRKVNCASLSKIYSELFEIIVDHECVPINSSGCCDFEINHPRSLECVHSYSLHEKGSYTMNFPIAASKRFRFAGFRWMSPKNRGTVESNCGAKWICPLRKRYLHESMLKTETILPLWHFCSLWI